MRKARVFSQEKLLPRMSWSARNLYNLLARSTVPYHVSQLSFVKTALTMYQQRWRSKRMLRSYHGDWIPEKRFKRWFLPTQLPRFQPPQIAADSASTSSAGPRRGGAFDKVLKARHSSATSPVDKPSDSYSSVTPHTTSAEMDPMPTTSLFMTDVERRIDVAVFRCCFARSAYEARALVVQGKVKLNGLKCNNPNQLLNPGDLISVDPHAVPLLSEKLAEAAQKGSINDAVSGDRERRSREASSEDSADDVKAMTEYKNENAASEGGETASDDTAGKEASTDSNAEASKEASTDGQAVSAKGSTAEKRSPQMPKAKVLPPGVLPFTLPPYAAPFLFIPPYLEVSFTTCSAIYVRHPTIVPHAVQNRDGTSKWSFRTDLPSPYPAGGELYNMAWEHYTRNSPRVRADERRLKLEARHGRNGFFTQRAKDLKQKRSALQRGWGRTKQATAWRDQLIAAHAHEARGAQLGDRVRSDTSP